MGNGISHTVYYFPKESKEVLACHTRKREVEERTQRLVARCRWWTMLAGDGLVCRARRYE